MGVVNDWIAALAAGMALYVGQPDTEAKEVSRTIPARAVDVFNGTREERLIVVRTASRHEVLFRKKVSPGMPEPMFVRPEYWPCDTELEAALDGKNFRLIRGDICAKSETDDPLVLRVLPGARPELIPVDPE